MYKMSLLSETVYKADNVVFTQLSNNIYLYFYN